MSVQHSPLCERRRSHSVNEILAPTQTTTKNPLLSKQPFTVQPSVVHQRAITTDSALLLKANVTDKQINKNYSPIINALPTVALATVTTSTSTTTTASTTTIITTLTPASIKPVMSTSTHTVASELDLNPITTTLVHSAPKRSRSSPDKTQNTAHKKTKKQQQQPAKQTQLTYWLSKPPTANKFEILAREEEENEDDNTKSVSTQDDPAVAKQKNAPKPPPIYVQNVKYLSTLINALNDRVQNNYELKVLNNNEIKIQTKDSTYYTTTIKLLKERNTQYYTFRPKEEKGFRVILRNMHHSTDKEDIISELAEYGHTVTNIYNILKKDTKQPLPLFSLELPPNPNNKDIYNLTNLLHCKVKFEPPHQKRTLPQCLNCQKYGHTKNYCTKSPVCVKCAGPHTTSNCPIKDNSNDVKCALCGEKHTANYRGCMVYKALRVKRFPALRKKELPNPQLTPQNEIPVEPTKMTTGTYAQVAAQTTNNNPTNTTSRNDDIDELKRMINQLISQMSNMMNIITLLVTKIDGQTK